MNAWNSRTYAASAATLVLALACTFGNVQCCLAKTVDFDALCNLKAEGVTMNDVRRLLGSPTMTGKSEVGPKAHYLVEVRDKNASYRGRSPIDRKQFIAEFGYNAEKRVCYVDFASGSKLDAAPARAFKVGVTTRKQVYDAYGYPDDLMRDADGSSRCNYWYKPIDTPIAPEAAASIGGRVYQRSSVTNDQEICVTFDNSGVVTELRTHFGIRTNFWFAGNLFSPDLERISKAKLNRLTSAEIVDLFGQPNRESHCDCGETECRYGEGTATMTISFGTNGVERNIYTIGIGKPEESESVENRHTGLNILFAVLYAGTGGKSGPAPGGPMRSSEFGSKSGEKIDSKLANTIELGKATRQDILNLVGVPDSVMWCDDGSIEYRYHYSRWGVKTATYALKAHGSSETETCVVRFDRAGILKKITVHKSSLKI